MKSTNIALSEDLWERANILAIRKRISFTQLVREALEHVLDGHTVELITIDKHGKAHPPEAEILLKRKA